MVSCDRTKTHPKLRSPCPRTTRQSPNGESHIDSPEAITPPRWHVVIECASILSCPIFCVLCLLKRCGTQAGRSIQRQFALGTTLVVSGVLAIYAESGIVLSSSSSTDSLMLLSPGPLHDSKLSHRSVSQCPRDHMLGGWARIWT